MANLKNVIVVGAGPIKSNAGMHGADIGFVYVDNPPVELTVDLALEHDSWLPITNPNPWKNSGKQGWIKKSRVAFDVPDKFQYVVEIDKLTGAMTWRLIG